MEIRLAKKTIAVLIIFFVVLVTAACSLHPDETELSEEAAVVVKQIEEDSKEGEGYHFDLNNDVFAGNQNDQEIGDYRISFYGEIKNFSGLTIGKGADDDPWAEHLQITEDKVTVFDVQNQSAVAEYTHGLNFSKYIVVCIESGTDGTAMIEVLTDGASFIREDAAWVGRNGRLFAEACGGNTVLNNCSLSYFCNGWKKSKWLYGDSYFSMYETDRWTTYLIENGASDIMLSGRIGEGSKESIKALKTQLKYGTPQTVVWCVGMNDGDSKDEINRDYKECLDELSDICKEKNIDLVIGTVPTCPRWLNDHKNEYIKKTGYPVIDFADAVGSYDSTTWNEGMLEEAEERVHPTEKGAVALYEKAVTAYPELLK